MCYINMFVGKICLLWQSQFTAVGITISQKQKTILECKIRKGMDRNI